MAEVRNEYHYSADGVKRKVVNNVLKQIFTENGYIEGNVYHYYIKDHLGSNRVVVKSTNQIWQWVHYHPFGMIFGDANSAYRQPYKYTGQEYDHSHGLNLYDYKARFYDPSVGRFLTMDPLAEKYYSISPYAYCGNNPIRFTDPTGMFIDDFQLNRNGLIGFLRKTDDKFDRLYASNENGTIDEEQSPLIVNDKSLLPQLSQDRDDYKGHYASTNSSEVGKVFIFASNNSDVEWGLQGVNTEQGKQYVIATSKDNRTVSINRARELSGFNEEQIAFALHSHPDIDGTRGASGDLRDVKGGYIGDMSNISRRYDRFLKQGIKLPPHYIYHKHSKNLYYYTPWESSIFIRHIKRNTGLDFIIPK